LGFKGTLAAQPIRFCVRCRWFARSALVHFCGAVPLVLLSFLEVQFDNGIQPNPVEFLPFRPYAGNPDRNRILSCLSTHVDSVDKVGSEEEHNSMEIKIKKCR
jgi:hypothetical protein